LIEQERLYLPLNLVVRNERRENSKRRNAENLSPFSLFVEVRERIIDSQKAIEMAHDSDP
jgi:hypothetical protein